MTQRASCATKGRQLMDRHRLEEATVTVEEAARHLGIGRSLAYDLAKRGELPGVLRLGRIYRVSRCGLDRALGVDASALVSPSGDEAA